MSVNEREKLNKTAREIGYTAVCLGGGARLHATSVRSEQS